jgi:hypothetical protein
MTELTTFILAMIGAFGIVMMIEGFLLGARLFVELCRSRK